MEKGFRRGSSLFACNFPIAVFTVDLERRITSWSLRAEELTHLKAEEVIGKDCKEVLRFSCCSKGCTLRRRALQPVYEEDCVIEVDGKRLNVVKITDYLRDAKGNVIGGIEIFEDLSERRKLEEVLRESKRRFQDIALCSADFIWEVDERARYTFVAGRVEEILGYSPEELIGMTPYQLMPKEEAERIKKIFRGLAANKEPVVDLENWNLTKDGRKVLLLTNGVPILDERGRLLGYRGVDKDITERKRMEEALRESEERFRTLFESATDFIFILDVEGRIVKVNQATLKVTGYAEDEVIGKWMGDFFSPDSRGVFADRFSSLLERSSTRYEGGLLCKDGRVLETDCSASVMYNEEGKVIGFVNFLRDITEQKKVEQALREAEERYRTVVENSPSGIFVLQDGVLEFVNDQFAKIYGCSKGHLLGRPFKELLHPQERASFDEIVQKILDSNRVIRRLELRGVKPEGETIILGMTLLPFDYGDQRALLGHVADITKRRQIEKELRESNRKLQKALDDLKRMQSRLIQQEKMASISQLAAGVAHEMNNPLGFVLSNFETLREYVEDFAKLLMTYHDTFQNLKVGQVLKEDQLKRLEDLERELDLNFILEDLGHLFQETEEGLKRLKEIIQNLRQFSRVDQVGEYSEYNINDGIRSALVITKNEYKYHAEVETDLGDIPDIYCHPGQINEVFMNIIGNAAQAIKSQNREDKGKIFIKTYSDENYVYCVISDDGPGIPKDIQSKIFDPFFTTKEVGKGTGLGLSISYDIVVNKHKGEIFVESEVGKGTTFTIKLPIRAKFDSDG